MTGSRWSLALLLSVTACGKLLGYPSAAPERSAALCADGIDNDFDDKVDCNDEDCTGFCSEETVTECSDQRDNDGDGLVDGADPRCWLLSPPEVQRCAEARGLELVETFDADARWPWSFGSRRFLDFHQGDPPAGRQDLMMGFSTPNVDDVGAAWLKRQTAFSGSWRGFELSLSVLVPHDARLRAAIAPIQFVPPDGNDGPRPGAETALLSVTIDTTQERPTLALNVEGAPSSTPLSDSGSSSADSGGADDFNELKVGLDDQGVFYATLTAPNGAKTELHATAPSSLSLPPSRLVFWGSSNAPGGNGGSRVALDDLHLKVSGEYPCGFRAPQIPGPSCEFKNHLESFGHQVAVARGSGEQLCALVTASTDAYVAHPEALTAWSSPDGVTWEPASSYAEPPTPLPAAGALVGAGIANDGRAYEVVVAYREAEGVRLGFASGESCGQWGELVPGPLLPFVDAEPPSYVIGAEHSESGLQARAKHEVYFTLPPGEDAPRNPTRRTLWRLTRNADAVWGSPPELFSVLPPSVASPVSVQQLGARDLVLVHPTAGTDTAGIGLLVSDTAARPWESPGRSPFLALPRPIDGPTDGDMAFDGFGATSAALSLSGQSGFLLYAGSSALGTYYNGVHPLLSVGTARLSPSGEHVTSSNSVPPSRCGNGSCDAGEVFSSCPADCPRGGQTILTDVFSGEKPWERVSDDDHPAAVEYVDAQHAALNWSAASIIRSAFNGLDDPPVPPSTWAVLPLERAIVGDFELSFDFLDNWFYSPRDGGDYSLYVGLGTSPEPAVEGGAGIVPPGAGVFARVQPSGCYDKYVVRPSVHALGNVFELDNETLGDPYSCLLERHWFARQPRKLTLRRVGNEVTLGAVRDNACGVAERTISYTGALPDLPALLIGFGGGDFGGGGYWEGAGTISNLELRLLDDPERCPKGKAFCGSDAQQATCVDTATSVEHCGACGHACAANEICSNGDCGAEDSGITWLSLDGDRASSAQARNGELGIDGRLFIDADPCVKDSIRWDPKTRCVAGTLCGLGRNYENYGMSVRFAFSGSSDDATSLWNPEDYGVRGLAWDLSRTDVPDPGAKIPLLQFWVLNMDPSWNGECTQAPCEIPGPGDGMPRPPLTGTLLFDDMVKDDWSYNGIRYTFDPKAVFALEFNLPAEQAGIDKDFAFCVERLGVIR